MWTGKKYPGSRYPKNIVITDPETESFVSLTKITPRLAHVDLVQTPSDVHGSFKNIRRIKSFLPVFRNLQKNKIAVEYNPIALSRSRNPGAVTNTDALREGYIAIAKRLGFTPRMGGVGFDRLEP